MSWKKILRIALFYRKLGLIDRINFDKLREKVSLKRTKRNKLTVFNQLYSYYMRKKGSRLALRIQKTSFLRLRFKRYAKKLKSFHRKLYKKKKKYGKLTPLKKRYLLRKKNWPLLLKLEPYRLIIKRILNNVFVNLIAVESGNIIVTKSAGSVGFRGSKKTTHITAEKVVNTVAKRALELDIFRLDVVIQAAFIDKYVKTALRGLR